MQQLKANFAGSMVRKPVNKMKAGLIEDLREDILRIANGGT